MVDSTEPHKLYLRRERDPSLTPHRPKTGERREVDPWSLSRVSVGVGTPPLCYDLPIQIPKSLRYEECVGQEKEKVY